MESSRDAHACRQVLWAAMQIVPPASQTLPGRDRILACLRREGRIVQGDPDVWKIAVASMQKAGLVRTQPGKNTRVVSGTIESLWHRVCASDSAGRVVVVKKGTARCVSLEASPSIDALRRLVIAGITAIPLSTHARLRARTRTIRDELEVLLACEQLYASAPTADSEQSCDVTCALPFHFSDVLVDALAIAATRAR